MFNSSLILLKSCTYSISQPKNSLRLQPVRFNATNQRFIDENAHGAFVPSESRPELTYESAVCSQYRSSISAAISLLNNTVAHAHKYPSCCIWSRPPNISTCHLAVRTDEIFANKNNMSSQIGFIIVWLKKIALQTFYSTAEKIRSSLLAVPFPQFFSP